MCVRLAYHARSSEKSVREAGEGGRRVILDIVGDMTRRGARGGECCSVVLT